ncbi:MULTISPECIES: hypothetical protein [Streptomyces]|uniref:Uncharacterized protein n=1 Tax=Streptomyces bottropensis ATCC 25435 TaxID=1054862 RepID=M3EK55_9ACTN|nr:MULTISPECIES: hypothetical protein [Streptomyces]EMF56746.1 hypothetical protein SBD_1828 [Streptomyces bottropensis ATCC 25435]
MLDVAAADADAGLAQRTRHFRRVASWTGPSGGRRRSHSSQALAADAALLGEPAA